MQRCNFYRKSSACESLRTTHLFNTNTCPPVCTFRVHARAADDEQVVVVALVADDVRTARDSLQFNIQIMVLTRRRTHCRRRRRWRRRRRRARTVRACCDSALTHHASQRAASAHMHFTINNAIKTSEVHTKGTRKTNKHTPNAHRKTACRILLNMFTSGELTGAAE